MIVGLTGGIGAGKSTVAGLLAAHGALIIDTDALAHDVVRPPSAVLDEIAAAFGRGVLRDDGTLDRAGLARIVFADPAQRARLNAIVHPAVRARAEAALATVPARDVVVLVVPLLFESDYDWGCDVTLAVVAPRDARIARVSARDGMPAADVEARMRAQADEGEHERRADAVIRNDGDAATLAGRVDDFWRDHVASRRETTG